MRRRNFLSLGLATLVLPKPARAAYEATRYEWGMRTALRQSGQTVIYNFRSSWSLTCQIKEQILAELKSDYPAYRSIVFVDVDYDTYGPSQWVERMKVRRRSTLVVMKGEREVARLENEPERAKIKSFLDAALAA